MGELRDIALRRLEEVGQSVGQPLGQEAIALVPSRPICPDPVGQEKPQKSAKNHVCPTVPHPKGRDSGTTPHQSGTTVGTSRGTSLDPRIAAARLREWHGRLSKIDQLISPPGWTLNQWMKTTDAACWLYENFASAAVRDGWSALCLFGVLPTKPGWGGLADRLGDARNLKMTADRATWSAFGVRSQFARGTGDSLAAMGMVPMWEFSA